MHMYRIISNTELKHYHFKTLLFQFEVNDVQVIINRAVTVLIICVRVAFKLLRMVPYSTK